MSIKTNPKPTIYRKLYENTGPGPLQTVELAQQAPHIERASQAKLTSYIAKLSKNIFWHFNLGDYL